MVKYAGWKASEARAVAAKLAPSGSPQLKRAVALVVARRLWRLPSTRRIEAAVGINYHVIRAAVLLLCFHRLVPEPDRFRWLERLKPDVAIRTGHRHEYGRGTVRDPKLDL